MNFKERFNKLNKNQRLAVESINGTVMIVAGPGTGKTELLGMRAAQILKETDTLPENILCLTFTNAGVLAMRERLGEIIGSAGAKVNIETFHSFGSNIIQTNPEYFYNGADFDPADEIKQAEILLKCLEKLPNNSFFSSKYDGSFSQQSAVEGAINDIRRSGLSTKDILQTLDENETYLDTLEAPICDIFSTATRVNKNMLPALRQVCQANSHLQNLPSVNDIQPLGKVIIKSVLSAIEEDESTGKLSAISRFKKDWLEKSNQKFVFKTRARDKKMREIAHIYEDYRAELTKAHLFDYSDMILNAIEALENNPDLLMNLQENYLYIMVDEFQDTNLSQMKILSLLTNSPVNEGNPNLLVVGDDDQAIYSFQGAEVGNILTFREKYPKAKLITLKDNYRSDEKILKKSREIILAGEDRLENNLPDLDKSLTANKAFADCQISLESHTLPSSQYYWVAEDVARRLGEGQDASSIAIIARQHNSLTGIIPFLKNKGVKVNYEKKDNILDLEFIKTLELTMRIVLENTNSNFKTANSLLPEFLSHPMWGFAPADIWKLSLKARQSGNLWLETMQASSIFKPISDWLMAMSANTLHQSLENMIDLLTGTEKLEGVDFKSQIYDFYFDEESRQNDSENYLVNLEALRSLRQKARDHFSTKTNVKLSDLLELIDIYRALGKPIVNHLIINEANDSVKLLTAHGAKGLEFETVHIIDANEKAWMRKGSVNGLYPENLRIQASTGSRDENIRLLFVAMTRAKKDLIISHPSFTENATAVLPVALLDTESWQKNAHNLTVEDKIEVASIDWRDTHTEAPKAKLIDLLQPRLEKYSLNATELNSFCDVAYGSLQNFLLSNLLRFPSAPAPSASFGTAVHDSLKNYHDYFAVNQTVMPTEDLIKSFKAKLLKSPLEKEDLSKWLARGEDTITKFIEKYGKNILEYSHTELSLRDGRAKIDEVRFSGQLDLVKIDKKNKTIEVADYKTGNPITDWKGTKDSEKIKLHKYRQQLLFYKLLLENHPLYSEYEVTKGELLFVEPDKKTGQIFEPLIIDLSHATDELTHLEKLTKAVWARIMTLNFEVPEEFTQNSKGIKEFEDFLVAEV